MWSICALLIVVFSIKVGLKLYLFINACNVDDWFDFVKKFILKSPIITVKQAFFVKIFYDRIEMW
jgi:hypothetical protein